MRAHHISVKHALDGLYTAIHTQPNFRVHISLSVLSIILGFVLEITRIEWIVLFSIISIGMAVELLNTAVEFTVDLLTSQYHLLAKYAKDTAAAAMLVYAVCSVIIGCLIFLPRIWQFI